MYYISIISPLCLNKGKGVCAVTEDVLTDAFVDEWDGTDFTQFWDKDGYCFCSEQYCAESEAIGCECSGDEGCCCDASNSCNAGNLCKPNTDANVDYCIAQDASESICGTHGDFIQCAPTEGVVFSTCGSGSKADCGTYSGMCPSGSYNGIRCGYSDLGTIDTNGQWTCGSYGVKQSCPNENPLLIGICGSGAYKDCKTMCVGYAGILCGKADGVNINENGCFWKDQYHWGKFVDCPDGFVGSGYCGSGRSRDCYGNLARLKCCPLSYYNRTGQN